MSHGDISDQQIFDRLDGLGAEVGVLTGKVDSLADKVQVLTEDVQVLTGDLQVLSGEVRVLSSAVTSLTRTVDRIDQRLVDVEKQTTLIPGLVEAVMNFGNDTDNHERRLRRLEKLPA